MSYSCSDLVAHEWTGSAFHGMCPNASIALVASETPVGDILECGIFNATVTNITPARLRVLDIDSNLTFTPTMTLPTNGSVVICQDAHEMELERHTINIQGEKEYLAKVIIASLPGLMKVSIVGSTEKHGKPGIFSQVSMTIIIRNWHTTDTDLLVMRSLD